MMLSKRVALITGAGSGIGESTAKLFAKEGAKVVVADFNFESGKRVADEINAAGGIAIALKVNVADRESVNDMVWHVMHTFGRIDCLVNNAGITKDATFLKMTQSNWDDVIATNLTGIFNCIHSVIPHMVKEGYGRIINTSSIVGTAGNFAQANYGASKAGVIGLTKSLAKEFGRKGININAVAPGFILTPMVKKMPEKVIKMMEEKIPLQRLGEPEDIAQGYLYLASDMSKYVNGTVLEIDRGIMF